MADRRTILAIDQGTTSSRAILFDAAGEARAIAQTELRQYYPHPGWVEHDPEQIWRDTLATARAAIARGGGALPAAIGITNQRETTVLWERATGRVLHNAIVWQDRRTAAVCDRLRAEGHEPLASARTGLSLDSYFSATKLGWLLDHIPGARARAAKGELAFGTIDSFLLWRLTGGRVHATDATNASRTLLFDIHRQAWCPDMLALFDIPAALLPEVRDNSTSFGETDAALFGAPIPITGMAGDQQAALIGQQCFALGMAKATYGTGCFVLLNTGATPVASANRLLTTTAYRLAGVPTYAIEGSIFVAGAAIKWLRDGLGLIADAAQTEAMAAGLADNGGVYLVPAFVGLGAPYWDAEARGLIAGLTFASEPAHIVRAALEAVAYQTHELLGAMARDGAGEPGVLRVDGGMVANGWLCRFLAGITATPVERPATLEATALGAAFLAGMAAGVWGGIEGLATLDRSVTRFDPTLAAAERAALLGGWRDALTRASRPVRG